MGDYRDARDNATVVLAYSNVTPFKWMRNLFGCPSCDFTATHFNSLEEHNMSEHADRMYRLDILRNSRPRDVVKADVTDLKCELCQESIADLTVLIKHLQDVHDKPVILKYESGVIPYFLREGFKCAICGESFPRFVALHAHVLDHYPKSECNLCGMLFPLDRLRKHFLRAHQKSGDIKFSKTGNFDVRKNAAIILECSNVCPFKWYRNVFGCAYCTFTSPEFVSLKSHMLMHPVKKERIKILRNSRTDTVVKVDVTDLKCDLCLKEIDNVSDLMDHLKDEHDKPIIQEQEAGIIPYYLHDVFECAYSPCTKSFDCFIKLNTHVITHNIKCTCPLCGQNFSSKERLRNHNIRFHGTKTRLLKLVPKSKSKASSKPTAGLRCVRGYYEDARHNAAIIVECTTACPFKWHRNMFGCASCNFTSADFGPIKDHVEKCECDSKQLRYARPADKIKIEVTDLKCKLCDQSFSDLKLLLCHLGDNHDKPIKREYDLGIIPYLLNDNEFTCSDCGLKFDRFIKLNCHMNDHYPNCVCSFCGQSFINANRLKNHIKWQHHNEQGRNLKLRCTLCDMTFPTRSSKQNHMQFKHGQLPHKCPYCSDTFTSYVLRLEHLNEVHGKKIEYPCTICSETFKSASKRAKHLQSVHSINKDLVCPICDYRTAYKHQLKYHMIRHGGERKYKCEVCLKSYPRRSALSLHMRIHNNDRRYVCKHCGSAFVQKCSLTCHLKTHHPYDN